MKKLYAFLFFAFLCCWSFPAFAQVVALPDAPLPANTTVGSWLYNANGTTFSVLQNDTFNGAAIGPQTATITVTAGANSNISINPSNGQVWVLPTLPAGTYTLTYQVCMNAGGACATSTLTFSTCSQLAPTFSVVPQTCSSPAMAFLNDLPSGDWTLLVDPYPFWTNDGVFTIEGSGESYALNLDPEIYMYRIKVLSDSGCLSPYVEVNVPYMQIIGVETVPTYFDANTDGIVNVGDLILCDITIFNLSDCDVTNVNGQNNVITFPTVDVPAGQFVTVTGFYQITAQDILQGTVSNWEAVVGTSPLGQVYAKAFFTLELPIPTGFHFYAFADLNMNGMQESNEPLVPYGTFVYQQNDGPEVEVQSYTGEFNLFETNLANSYDVHFVPGTLCGNGFTSSFVYNDLTIDASSITEHGFPLDPSGCVDVGVWLYGNNAVPGFESYSTILVRNESLLQQNITITYVADPAVTVNDVSGGSSFTITGNTASISVTLDPLETTHIYVWYDTPAMPAVSLGDQLTFTAAINQVPNDAVMENNDAILIRTVVGSFDPNSKSESHGDEILFSAFGADETLNYTINFENTGTANAINVKLNDVLDAQLDETSVRLIGSTHDVQMSRVGSNLEFDFTNIQLPPSEEGTMIGKGSVQFTVKMKPGFAVGDVVPNFASIYFDTNPAIITNLVATEFVAEMSVSDANISSLRLYPNPAKHTVLMAGAQIDSLEIIDITGKTVMQQQVGAMQANLDVSGLSNGMYLARITSANAIKTLRFVKQ